jgi:26S proteasome subunit RPN7
MTNHSADCVPTTTRGDPMESPDVTAAVVVNFIEQQIVNKYNGEAQFQRLFSMIRLLSSSSLQKKEAYSPEDFTNPLLALRVATVFSINAIQQQRNVSRYKEIYHQHIQTNPLLQSNHPILNGSQWIVPPYDVGWVQSNEHAILQQRELLSLRLQTAQSHLNKDAIRIAYMNLSLYYLHTYVNYNEALNMALRSKEYCTTRYQTTVHTILILVVALYLRNFQLINDYVRHIDHIITSTTIATSAPADDMIPLSHLKYKILLVSALERMSMGDYNSAAQKFRQVAMKITDASKSSTGHVSSSTTTTPVPPASVDAASSSLYSTVESMIFGEHWDKLVVAPDDIAIYAALLTLAVEDDRTVGIAFADDPDAIACFERVPLVRDILHSFYKRSNYKEAWDLLEKHVFPMIQYDIYLQHMNTFASNENRTHLHMLRNMIRTKAILFYWNAYQQCPLVNMMESLGSGITATDELQVFQGTILQLLKNRFLRPDNAEDAKGSNSHNYNMMLPMDTRLDTVTHTLTRTTNFFTSMEADRDAQCYYNTSLQLHRAATRVLDDTYSTMVRLACLEHDIVVKAPSGSTKRRTRGDASLGSSDFLFYQPMESASVEEAMAALPPPEIDVESEDDEEEGEEYEVQDDDFVDSNAMNPEDLY